MYVNGIGPIPLVNPVAAAGAVGLVAASPAAVTLGAAVATGYLAQRLLRDRPL